MIRVYNLTKKIFHLTFILLLSHALSAQVIDKFPYLEDFNSFTNCAPACGDSCVLMNGWINDRSGDDQMEWFVGNSTPTAGTGPSDDYPGGGKFLYIESDCPGIFPEAILNSPYIDLSDLDTTAKLEFWYHSFGGGVFFFTVQFKLKPDSTWGSQTNITLTSEDAWKQVVLDLGPYEGRDSLQFRITATKFSTPNDIAIDFINIRPVMPIDGGIDSVVSNSFACGTTDSVFAILKNYGTKDLTNANINWSVGGTAQASISWTGALTPNQTEKVYLGTISVNTAKTIVAWVTNPNSISENYYAQSGAISLGLANDTAVKNVLKGIDAATFKIGGPGKDFNSWTQAINSLSNGVCGPITFMVHDSTFVEQVVFSPVPNSSSVNTITFESVSGDSSQIHLYYEPRQVPWGGEYLDLRVMRFDSGAANFRFKNLGIASKKGLGSDYASRVLYFYGAAEDIEFSNCFLSNDTFPSSFGSDINRLMHFKSPSWPNISYPKNIRFYNNKFDCTFGGLMSGTIDSILIFENNVVRNFGTTGMDLSTVNGCDFYINNNIFPDSNLRGFIKISNNNKTTEITGNVFINHPVIIENASSFFTSNKTHLYNNVITSSPLFNQYAIEIKSSNNATIIHNSTIGGVKIIGRTNTLHNNSIYGAGVYALNTEFDALKSAENNNYYVDSNTLIYITFPGPPSTMQFDSLKDWVSYSGMDLKSSQSNPNYNSIIDLRSCSEVLDNGGQFINEVPTDINSNNRDITGTDIGAYEFSTPGEARISGAIVCTGDTAELSLGGQAGSYLWSTGETTPTIQAPQTGDYWVIYSGLCGTIKDTATIQVLDPTPSYESNIIGLALSLVNTSQFPGTDLSWDFGDGTNSEENDVLHVYNNPGTYVVTLTATNNCGTFTQNETFTFYPVGIDEETSSFSSLVLYPNPSNGQFNILFKGDYNKPYTVEVYNQQGQIVYQETDYMNIGKNNKEFNLDLANGLYFIKLNTDLSSTNKKILINK